jgi:hypothetical protein
MSTELEYNKLATLTWFLTSAPINNPISFGTLSEQARLALGSSADRAKFDRNVMILNQFRDAMQSSQRVFQELQKKGEWGSNHFVSDLQLVDIWDLEELAVRMRFRYSREIESLRRECEELRSQLSKATNRDSGEPVTREGQS